MYQIQWLTFAASPNFREGRRAGPVAGLSFMKSFQRHSSQSFKQTPNANAEHPMSNRRVSVAFVARIGGDYSEPGRSKTQTAENRGTAAADKLRVRSAKGRIRRDEGQQRAGIR